MSNEQHELPIFPTSAPAVFCDPDAVEQLFADALAGLADVVDVNDDHLDAATPCAGFSVGELRTHTLGWLTFFAAALLDPNATTPRPEPELFTLAGEASARQVVERALADIQTAIAADAAGQMITMTSSRMAGDGVLAMALGEYIIHAWDLATATGQLYAAPEAAVEPAHEFLQGMVAPEYRGPDSGFFDAEVAVPEDAAALDRLLGFAGRDPQWRPAT